MAKRRFYYEQDGDARKNSCANSHYVVDRYADPCSDQARTDVEFQFNGAAMARAGRKLAAEWNENPPWEPWDTIQAERDGYVMPQTE